MKIKQKGKIPTWELDVTCKFCNTVITLEAPEDMYTESRPTGKSDGIRIDYSGPLTYHCVCPLCKKAIKVPTKSIREDIKEKVNIKPLS